MSNWPKKVKHRNKVLAKIYRPCSGRDSYRVAWKVKGQRMMKSFRTYSGKGGALEYAEALVPELYKDSTVTALTPAQADDALAAMKSLDEYFRLTGKRVSLRESAAEYVAHMVKLGGRTLGEAVDGYLSNVATIKRKSLTEAVEDYIALRKKETIPDKEGKRPALSPGYHYIIAMWLGEFAKTFPNTAVCDLTKELLNTYMGQHADVSSRTRNGRRTTLGMFFKWCVRQDYLIATHRLLEADGMEQEEYEPDGIEVYKPDELSRILKTANAQAEYRPLVPVVALCGLAGLRLAEAVRLTWEDVFHVKGHVEVSKTKSKTRSRRLVTACSALRQWLAPYRNCSGPVWCHSLDQFHDEFNSLLASIEIAPKRNGLRHGFCTYHFALNSNENLTAAEAGNSPDMIHAHYKGLATKAEAKKWFAVKPAKVGNVIHLAAVAKG